jgi:hypothetical protein
MLRDEFMPELEALMGEEIQQVIFQQNGATPHRRQDDVRHWLMETFPQRTIGLGSTKTGLLETLT